MTRDEEADEIVRRLKGAKLTTEQLKDKIMEIIAKKMAEELDDLTLKQYILYERKDTV